MYLDASNRLVFSYDIPYTSFAEITDITAGTDFTAGTHASTTYNSTDQYVQLLAPSTAGTYTSAIQGAIISSM